MFMIQEYADERQLGYLETFDLTKGKFTFDGVHYGKEVLEF